MFFLFLEKCHFNNQTRTCPDDHLCGFRLEQNSLQQGCTSHTNLMGLQILTTIDIQTLQEELLITFVCNYQQCNSEQNFQQIKSFIEQYSHLTAIRQAVNTSRMIQTTTSTNTNTTTSTHFQQTTTTKTTTTTTITTTTAITTTTTATTTTITTTITMTTTTNNSSKCSVYQCYLIINSVAILFFILYF